MWPEDGIRATGWGPIYHPEQNWKACFKGVSTHHTMRNKRNKRRVILHRRVYREINEHFYRISRLTNQHHHLTLVAMVEQRRIETLNFELDEGSINKEDRQVYSCARRANWQFCFVITIGNWIVIVQIDRIVTLHILTLSIRRGLLHPACVYMMGVDNPVGVYVPWSSRPSRHQTYPSPAARSIWSSRSGSRASPRCWLSGLRRCYWL